VLSLLLPCLLLQGGAPATTPAKPIRTLRPQQVLAAQPVAGEKRIALVIGNGAYTDSPLKNPVNDARAMSATLRRCGFTVIALENASLQKMREALRDFGGRIAQGGVGLFYFAGHGLQVKGKNYLVPVNADIQAEDEVAGAALDVDSVLAKLETARNRLNILILDACRNDPFVRSFRSASHGLAPLDAPMGTFIAFATAPGRTAADGSDSHGLYTEQLLKALDTPGLTLENTFKRVLSGVRLASNNQQIPWTSSSVEGDFYFVQGRETAVAQVPMATDAPASMIAPATSSLAAPTTSAPVPMHQPGETLVDPVSGITFCWIPSGSFDMGSDSGRDDEQPVHRVTLTRGFWMGKTEVTQFQWESTLGRNPSRFKYNNNPVDGVSWADAKIYLAHLTAKAGTLDYRLPTEAEWEYACRAGTTDERYGDLDAIAWYEGNSESSFETHPVGLKQANAWGLNDTLGNVWEWCEDWYGDYSLTATTDPMGPSTGLSKVIRGGSIGAYSSTKNVRSASRASISPDSSSYNLGFRVVAVARTP
jgi:formylglycine-generating enzyme required for sulfatase activity